jgi:NADH-quinone oxidoreductase subunit F
MANQICFATRELENPWSLETYLSIGGYQALKKCTASGCLRTR